MHLEAWPLFTLTASRAEECADGDGWSGVGPPVPHAGGAGGQRLIASRHQPAFRLIKLQGLGTTSGACGKERWHRRNRSFVAVCFQGYFEGDFIRTNFDESSAKISAASASHDAPKVDASRVRFLSCSSDAPSIGVSA